MIRTVLLDLDGVVRHFNPAHVAEVEVRHGLEPGSLQAAAFTPDVLEPAITGKITRRRWTEHVGQLVGSQNAADEWMAERGTLDAEMLELIAELRSTDITVAILTNGTSTIAEEMDGLGLTDKVDEIFNSADIGYAKPDVRAFQTVCTNLGVDPADVFFTDDSPSKLTGAIELGMTAKPFTSVQKLRADLRANQLLQ